MRWEGFRIIVNSDSGMMNTDAGKTGKVFTINQNGCSRSAAIGVHVESEWVLRKVRNMYHGGAYCAWTFTGRYRRYYREHIAR
jgi:hypothetical protein